MATYLLEDDTPMEIVVTLVLSTGHVLFCLRRRPASFVGSLSIIVSDVSDRQVFLLIGAGLFLFLFLWWWWWWRL
jgi:ABC-type Mn2+/Zn2+ transport system permease subunit